MSSFKHYEHIELQAPLDIIRSSMKLSLRKRLPVVYFSYPYTDDPLRRCDEIQRIVVEAVLPKVSGRVVPLVPHFCFDALFNFPAGYTHEEIGLWEIELINRCDLLAFDPANMSSGVRWERSVAEMLGKSCVPFNLIDDAFLKKLDGGSK